MKRNGAVVIGMAAALACGTAWARTDSPVAGPVLTYAKNCAMCHGKDGKGNEKMAKMLKADPAALDLTSTVTQGAKDEDLAKTVTEGKGRMPKYGQKMKPDEVTGLVGYIRSLAGIPPAAGKEVSATGVVSSAPVSAAAEAPPVYAKHCASCHGKDGKGNDKMTKALKSDLAALDLLDDATLAQSDEALVKVTTDGKGRMPAYGKKLAADDIKALVAWMRSAK